jgi:NAD(P)-dependent dehydrogenase (short-subunit alcohol dehydrogenase family)
MEFGRQGANVVCAARREERLKETVAAIEQARGRGLAVVADVTKSNDVERMVRQTIDTFGQIDVLFNNAGSFASIGGLWEVDPDQWWHDVTVNLLGPMLCVRAVLPHMMARDTGLIINMNGGGSAVPLPGGSGYGCSKAALLRLTDTLARELEMVGSHVLVVAMGPGFVHTEMTEYQARTPQGVKWLPGSKQKVEQGRGRPPEDCAQSTVELLRHLRPEFNGRIFSTGEDFAELARQAAALKQEDSRVMRMK